MIMIVCFFRLCVGTTIHPKARCELPVLHLQDEDLTKLEPLATWFQKEVSTSTKVSPSESTSILYIGSGPRSVNRFKRTPPLLRGGGCSFAKASCGKGKFTRGSGGGS